MDNHYGSADFKLFNHFFYEFISDILARATSIKEALDVLKKGTLLWKARNKGGIFGIKFYRRNFRLDVPNLALTYTPNKNGVNSAFGSTNCAAPIAGKLGFLS